MSKHSLCRNKLTKRQEKLIRKGIVLTDKFQAFKNEVELELLYMQNIMLEINKSILDISMVMDKPKKERSNSLKILQSNEFMFQ